MGLLTEQNDKGTEVAKCEGLCRRVVSCSDWFLESEVGPKRTLSGYGIQTCPLVNGGAGKVFILGRHSLVRLFWQQEVKLTKRGRR